MENKENALEIAELQRLMILEMIEASIALSQELGTHDLKKDCNCIMCVNKRKRIMDGDCKKNWKYKI